MLFVPMSYAEYNLVIGNVTVINATSTKTAESLPNRWVRIKNGRIEFISAHPIDSGQVEYINGDGKYLISGLTDAHVHLKTMPGLLSNDQVTDLKERLQLAALQKNYLRSQGQRYLYYGVTQVIDPANTKQGITQFQQAGLSPKAFYCGSVPIYRGYNAQGFQYEELGTHRPYFVHQQNDPIVANSQNIKIQQSPSTVVKKMTQDGAICVKVYLEDGFGMASDIPLITNDTLVALKQAAIANGLQLMGHANATDMQRIAIEVQVDVLAHGNWNWLEHFEEQGLPKAIKAVAKDIVKHNIAYQPSLNVVRGLADVLDKEHLALPEYQNVLTEAQLNWYKSHQGQWFARELIQGWGGLSKEKIITSFKTKLEQGERVLGYLYQQGGTILLGSDTPPAPIYSSQPGLSSYWEMRAMHNAGIDLTGILAAATLNNAKQFGLLSDFGSVGVGKVANLLLLNSNPLHTIDAYNDIDSVILDGKRLFRAQLLIDD